MKYIINIYNLLCLWRRHEKKAKNSVLAAKLLPYSVNSAALVDRN